MESDDINTNLDNEKGALFKRKDFLGVDQLADSHPNRTYYYKKNLNLNEIIETCSKKLQMDPENGKALYLRGSSYFKKNLFEEAITDLSKIIDLESNNVECLYMRGVSLSKLDRQEDAIVDLTKVLEINPEHVNAAFARGACYNTLGMFSNAIEDYNFALLKDQATKSKDNKKSQMSMAANGIDSPYTIAGDVNSLADESRFENNFSPVSTRHMLSGSKHNIFASSSNSSVATHKTDFTTFTNQTVNTANPANIMLADEHHAQGYSYRQQGNFELAIQEYSKAITIYPKHFKALFNRGFAYDKLQQFELAIQDYTQSITIEPKNAFAYYNRGISYDRMGNLELALIDFTKAISLQPTSPDFYHNRAFCYRRLGKLQEAIQDYNITIQINPAHFKAYFNRSYCFDRLGKHKEAINDTNAALLLQPQHAGCLCSRGMLYEKIGELDKALEDITNALQLGAEVVQTLNSRAKILSKLNRHPEAIQDLTKALSLKPNDLNILFSRAMCLKSYAQYVTAIGDFNQIIALDPGQILAYNHRGFCYRKLENYVLAIKDFTQAIQLASSNSNNAAAALKAYSNRAFIYAKLSRFEDAITDYTEILKVDPNNTHAYHNRGISYDKLNMFDQAIADFTRVLELDQSNGNSPKEVGDNNNSNNAINTSGSNPKALLSPSQTTHKHFSASIDEASKVSQQVEPILTPKPIIMPLLPPKQVNSPAKLPNSNEFHIKSGNVYAPKSVLTSPGEDKSVSMNFSSNSLYNTSTNQNRTLLATSAKAIANQSNQLSASRPSSTRSVSSRDGQQQYVNQWNNLAVNNGSASIQTTSASNTSGSSKQVNDFAHNRHLVGSEGINNQSNKSSLTNIQVNNYSLSSHTNNNVTNYNGTLPLSNSNSSSSVKPNEDFSPVSKAMINNSGGTNSPVPSTRHMLFNQNSSSNNDSNNIESKLSSMNNLLQKFSTPINITTKLQQQHQQLVQQNEQSKRVLSGIDNTISTSSSVRAISPNILQRPVASTLTASPPMMKFSERRSKTPLSNQFEHKLLHNSNNNSSNVVHYQPQSQFNSQSTNNIPITQLRSIAPQSDNSNNGGDVAVVRRSAPTIMNTASFLSTLNNNNSDSNSGAVNVNTLANSISNKGRFSQPQVFNSLSSSIAL